VIVFHKQDWVKEALKCKHEFTSPEGVIFYGMFMPGGYDRHAVSYSCRNCYRSKCQIEWIEKSFEQSKKDHEEKRREG